MSCYTILLCKESMPGEQRVSLIPEDVHQLIAGGHQVIVESGAGVAAGHDDDAYCNVGATIRTNHDNYAELFGGITHIVRAKRPNQEREALEAQALRAEHTLIGALDPFAKEGHIEAYKQAGISAYSIDQVKLPSDAPMNILASMSHIAGELAMLDAYDHTTCDPKRSVLIVGTGTAGMAALHKAHELGLQVVVLSSHTAIVDQLNALPHVNAHLLNKSDPITSQQALVELHAQDADMVITSARSSGHRAPILFPQSTLLKMKSGCCIVDLALSEGGNVEGSHHDQTVVVGDNVIVTNVSGYPKAKPVEASVKWSLATRLFIETLLSDPQNEAVQSAKVI